MKIHYGNINKAMIDKISRWFRQAFTYYLDRICKLNKLRKKNGGLIISIDESMIAHNYEKNIWLRAINN